MTEHNNTDKRLFLLDAYALIYRSYFAFIKNPRFNSKGLNTSAMFGFFFVEYPRTIAERTETNSHCRCF